MSGHSRSFAGDFCSDLGDAPLESQLNREHGGDVHAWVQRAGTDPAEILDFSASINPMGPAAAAREAFLKSYREISRYPDPYGTELRQALANRHEVQPDELLLGNGSTQLIYLLCTALRPHKALVVAPAFSEYANALKLAGAAIRFLPLPAGSNFKFSVEKFMAAWQRDHDIAFLSSPNSVTGQLIPKVELETIAGAALVRKQLVIVDEAFIDFAEKESIKHEVRRNPYLVVLRSLTKYYALPGLRLGYLLAETRRVAQLADYLEPWSVNAPAQKVALACLADTSFRIKTDRWLEREKSFLLRGLNTLQGFHCYPSAANFLLARMKNSSTGVSRLHSFLLQRNILIRPCDSFLGLGSNYFRIAVRRRADNQKLIAALKEWSA
jgi:threonine-phosphate decarboxylase